jgi:hypothetical protein
VSQATCSRWINRAWVIVALFLTTTMAGIGLQAQALEATILGRVTDTSGAAVADAKIRVRNLGTDLTQAVTTDDQGRYSVADLDVGTYEVDVDKTGFKKVVHSGVSLTVGSQLVVDTTLEVGSTEQTVTVEGQAPQVEITSSAIGSLIEPTQVANLPLNGRNYTQLLTLAPGVVTGDYQKTVLGGRGAAYSVSGNRAFGELFLLDNTNTTDYFGKSVGSSGVTGEAMGVEAIAEFQMFTNTYSAQYGGNGAVLDAVSKSGTNSLHGSAYEYLRNSVLDSRNYFDGPAIPEFRRNQIGASLGGPVKKNKAFFFVNYEGLRELQGLSQPVFVPDANARMGLLPGCTISPGLGCSNAPTLIPASANNAAGQVAPVIDSTVAVYPLPANASDIGGGIAQYTAVGNNIAHENYLLSRFDYIFSEKDSLFVRYVLDLANFTEPSLPEPSLWPVYATNSDHIATIEEKHIASQNVVNLARFSFVRAFQLNITTDGQAYPALQFYPPNRYSPYDGAVTVSGLSAIGPTASAPVELAPNHFVGADDVLWTHGAHTLRFGISLERIQENINFPFNENGEYTFNSLLNLLQGSPFLFLGVGPGPTDADAFRASRELYLTPYLQDDWKLTPKLTLNIGLRYEWGANPTEVHNLFYNLLNPAGPQGSTFVNVPHAFKNNPSVNNYDPRIGLAYDPFAGHKTAIRAGFGIFHDVIVANKYLAPYTQQPPFIPTTVVFPICFPACHYGPAAPNLSNAVAQYSSTQGWDYLADSTPYTMQYNLNIQRDLGAGTILTVGYVGSRGVHQWLAYDWNPPVNTGTPQNPVMSSLIGGQIVTHNRTDSPNNPFGPYGYLVNYTPVGYSSYNSLQMSLNHRLSHDLQAQLSYTYSKCLDLNSDGSGLEGEQFGSGTEDPNPYYLRYNWGPCDNDRRHNFIASSVYYLPFHGNKFVEGWQVSGIWNWVSGAPFSPLAGFDVAGAGPFQPVQEQRASWESGCTPSNAIVGQGIQWFKSSCFVLPAVGTLGNVGRNSLNGPRLFDVDMALMKETKLSEQFNLQFRIEAFNLFNEANLAMVGKPGNLAVFSQGPNGTGIANPNAGQMSVTATSSRQMQFALRLLF